MATAASLPRGWDAGAQALWARGDKPQAAIDAVLAAINRHPGKKPLGLVLQLAYYTFLIGDPAASARFLARIKGDYPNEPELLRNLAAVLSRSGQHEESLGNLLELQALTPDDYQVFDGLSHCYYRLKQYDAAAAAGTRSLELKDARHGEPAPRGWRLPDGDPAVFAAAAGKKDVIAFSLWGSGPRYLRGALDNALAMPAVYPGWVARFYVDETVPLQARQALVELGAELVMEPAGQGNRRRLTWRFKAANDPGVGRFLVRDVDSVVGLREKAAVDEWAASGCWFHIMRDWWTHTDLILAGMWGGVAGVLPELAPMIDAYAPGHMETPNIDQWFLRDRLWAYVRQSCHVHDRCFRSRGAHPWPGPAPEGVVHVGQNVYASDKAGQEKRLGPWLHRI